MSDKDNIIIKEDNYTAENIKILEGLEAVRKRPAMYIGSTGINGLHHLVYEVVDNSIDEAMAGYCTKIKVFVHTDNSITVIDNGRGIPVDMHEEGKSAAEVVMTTLHAGGKFDKDTYKVSGGLHGVGVSCVNALSSRLDLEIKKNNKVYYQKYEIGSPVNELKIVGETEKRGTKITFWPDDEIFEITEFDYDTLAKRLKELAFLNAGIKISLIDERENKKEDFYYEGGITEYINYLCEKKESIHKEPISFKAIREDVEIDIAFKYIDSYKEIILSFVNNINTIDGGTHLTGFKGALTRTLNNFCVNNNLFQKKSVKQNLTGEDVREGLVAIVSVRVKEPQFEGQTKGKLGNSEVKGIVESFINEKLIEYLEENFNVGKTIINKALLAASAREASRKAKELVRKSSLLESSSLPGKLADCQSKNPEECELYIVEGDSAGGSAKQGRSKRFQAILPLKGKILNVEKVSTSRMLDSDEIKTMISALGVGIGEENFDINKLRYHKIILMTDADVDGSHIRTLIMTFFFRYMRDIISRGYLYLAQPPLYLIKKGKSKIYKKNEREMDNYLIDRVGQDIVLEKDNFILSGEDLINYVKLISKSKNLKENISKQGIPNRITELLLSLIKDETIFHSEEETKNILEKLEKSKLFKNCSLSFDTEYSTYVIDIEYEQNGLDYSKKINWDFLNGPLFAEIKKVYDKINSYPKPPYVAKNGKEEFSITNEDSVADLLNLVKKNISIQRYKGLGEMNPDQLWETTMDPENRTLLKVEINDIPQSEDIFDTLMGSDASKRRDFIITNALNVRNLDV